MIHIYILMNTHRTLYFIPPGGERFRALGYLPEDSFIYFPKHVPTRVMFHFIPNPITRI